MVIQPAVSALSPPDLFRVGSERLRGGSMSNEKTKRCRYCGGTVWLDGDVVKCFMCSRPVDVPNVSDRVLSTFSRPKLPGSYGKTGLRHAK